MIIPTTITKKWQMTITREARRALDIRSPGRVVLHVDTKNKVMAIKKTPSIFDLAGKMVPKKHKGVSVLKARDYMEKHYERV